MHPSFLYEIAFHVAALIVLLHLRTRPHVAGALFKGYVLAYALARFAIEFVRGNPTYALGLSGSQVFLLVTVPVGAAWYLGHRPRGNARTGNTVAPQAVAS